MSNFRRRLVVLVIGSYAPVWGVAHDDMVALLKAGRVEPVNNLPVESLRTGEI